MSLFEERGEAICLSDEALMAAAVAEMPPQQLMGGIGAEMKAAENTFADHQADCGEMFAPTGEQDRGFADYQRQLQRVLQLLAEERKSKATLVDLLKSQRAMAEQQGETKNPPADPTALWENTAVALVEKHLLACLRPLRELVERQSEEKSFYQALQVVMALFPALKDREQQSRLVGKMAERSRVMGDDQLWQRRPEDLMKLAAMELFGFQTETEQAAIDAVAKAKEQQTIDEIKNRNAAKAGLAINHSNNRSGESNATEEQQVINAIFAAGKGGFFD